jgi:hypothetical protein
MCERDKRCGIGHILGGSLKGGTKPHQPRASRATERNGVGGASRKRPILYRNERKFREKSIFMVFLSLVRVVASIELLLV